MIMPIEKRANSAPISGMVMDGRSMSRGVSHPNERRAFCPGMASPSGSAPMCVKLRSSLSKRG